MSCIYIISRWYVDYSLDRVEQISLELALYFRVSVLQMFHHDAANLNGMVVVVFVHVVIQSTLVKIFLQGEEGANLFGITGRERLAAFV